MITGKGYGFGTKWVGEPLAVVSARVKNTKAKVIVQERALDRPWKVETGLFVLSWYSGCSPDNIRFS